ncbi:MAG: alpha/beta hydrolase [Acidimicrobiales bacterium]
MPTADLNGTTINYADSGGDGPAILFSHGLMDHTMFDAQVAAFSADYRCITWDERGFGGTQAPGPFTYWDSAADAIALLDHLGVDDAVFVGMSQGGFLSMRAALGAPTRVRALVNIDTAADVDDEETLEGYLGMMGAFASGEPAVVDAVAQSVAGLILGDDALAAEWIPRWKQRFGEHDITVSGGALLGRDDISADIHQIACPVLVIHGSDDHAIDLTRAQQVADNVQDCRGVVVVDGAAHAPNMTHPAIVNDAIAEFLAAL